MTRDHIANIIQVPLQILQAYADGKQIQLFVAGAGEWCDLDNLNFDDDPASYRIKPEPPKPVERWTYEYRAIHNSEIVVSTRTFPSRTTAEFQGRKLRGSRFIRSFRLVEAGV